MTRVLIVTDAPLIAAGARVLTEATGECEVVGTARDQATLQAALNHNPPDVVIIDLHMEDGAAIKLLWWLRQTAPRIEVVGLSDNDEESILAALQAGARGYLSRRTTAEDLSQAIRTVQQGGMVLHPMAAASLLQRLQGQASPTQRPETLTPRELEVLRLLVEGLTNKAIAGRLGISDHTVKFHIGAILGKLGAASRTEAVTQAVRQGLVPL